MTDRPDANPDDDAAALRRLQADQRQPSEADPPELGNVESPSDRGAKEGKAGWMKQEDFRVKFKRKFVENPFVPIGVHIKLSRWHNYFVD